MSNRTLKPGAGAVTIRGFTLIETLVALVVLSIGMLGIAALYVESLKAGRTAIYRTQAVSLAADMADRIRANPVRDNEDEVVLAIAANYQGAGIDRGCVASTANCLPADMAAHDVFIWRQRMQGLLPNASGEIEWVSDEGLMPDEYTIRISWSEVGEPLPVDYELVVQI